jgi:hypothetical protein
MAAVSERPSYTVADLGVDALRRLGIETSIVDAAKACLPE